MLILFELPAWSGNCLTASALGCSHSKDMILLLLESNQQQEQRHLSVLLVGYAMHFPVDTGCLTELQEKAGLQSRFLTY
jgi:hypothetical protein